MKKSEIVKMLKKEFSIGTVSRFIVGLVVSLTSLFVFLTYLIIEPIKNNNENNRLLKEELSAIRKDRTSDRRDLDVAVLTIKEFTIELKQFNKNFVILTSEISEIKKDNKEKNECQDLEIEEIKQKISRFERIHNIEIKVE